MAWGGTELMIGQKGGAWIREMGQKEGKLEKEGWWLMQTDVKH